MCSKILFGVAAFCTFCLTFFDDDLKIKMYQKIKMFLNIGRFYFSGSQKPLPLTQTRGRGSLRFETEGHKTLKILNGKRTPLELAATVKTPFPLKFEQKKNHLPPTPPSLNPS